MGLGMVGVGYLMLSTLMVERFREYIKTIMIATVFPI